MPYSSYDHDKLEAAETMRIERRIYFEAKDREIAPYASLPIAQLLSMRSESAAAEQAIFDDLKERAAAWEEQAGRTLLLDKTLEYVRTPHVQHTVPFPVSWTVKMKKKQKETQDILSYHSQAAGWSDKARAKASGGRQPIEECGRTGL